MDKKQEKEAEELRGSKGRKKTEENSRIEIYIYISTTTATTPILYYYSLTAFKKTDLRARRKLRTESIRLFRMHQNKITYKDK